MKKILSLFLLCLMTIGIWGQKTNQRDYVSVRFAPSHADWVYAVGEQVEMDVTPVRHYMPIQNLKMTYSWGPELRPVEVEKTISSGKEGTAHLSLSGMKEPGFKTLTVSVEVDGKTYTNYINIAFSPEKIQPTTQLPKDFRRFWELTIAKVREIPLKPLFTPMPALSIYRLRCIRSAVPKLRRRTISLWYAVCTQGGKPYRYRGNTPLSCCDSMVGSRREASSGRA